MRLWELVKLALDGVRRTPLRVALTALGVAIATGALVSMVGFAQGIQSQAEKPFREFDVLTRVTVRQKTAAGDERPRRRRASREAAEPAGETGPPIDDAAIERIRALPKVVLAYPPMFVPSAELKRGERAVKCLIDGKPRDLDRVEFYRRIVKAGRLFGAAPAKEIVIGAELSKQLGFETPEDAVGKTLTLEATGLLPAAPLGFRFEKTGFDLEIVGIVEPPQWAPGQSIGDRLAWLPMDLATTLPGARFEDLLDAMRRGGREAAPGYDSVDVRVARGSDAPEVERAIQAMGFATSTMVTQMQSMRTFFIVMDVLLAAVGTVALVVAGLGIVNTLLIAVLERRREIGAYKAVGASDGDIRVLFLSEAGLVGLLGGAGGLLLGRVVSWAIGLGVNAYARTKGVDQEIAFFLFPWWLMAGGVLFAIAASVVSGVYPASRAAKVDPILALRGE